MSEAKNAEAGFKRSEETSGEQQAPPRRQSSRGVAGAAFEPPLEGVESNEVRTRGKPPPPKKSGGIHGKNLQAIEAVATTIYLIVELI